MTSELIANIRKWQAADAAFEAQFEEKCVLPHSEYSAWRDKMNANIDAAKAFVGTFGNDYYDDAYSDDKLLSAFVALADRVEALEARIAAVMALKARPIDIMPNMTAGELYDAGRFVTLRDVKAMLLDAATDDGNE